MCLSNEAFLPETWSLFHLAEYTSKAFASFFFARTAAPSRLEELQVGNLDPLLLLSPLVFLEAGVSKTFVSSCNQTNALKQ